MSSKLQIHSSISSNLLLILSNVFFISFIVFFISVWFFMFSNFLLKTSNFSLHSSNCLPSSLIIFMIILYSLSHRLPMSTSLSSSSVVFIFHLEHVLLSVTSFCLICCFYFHVFSRLVTFPDLGEVAFCRGHPMIPSSALPFGHQSSMF